MQCKHCGYENAGGKFCENCGMRLDDQAKMPPEEMEPSESKVNYNTAGTKKMPNMYFRFFADVLKHPYAVSSKVNKAFMADGIITLLAYSLLIPLIIYFGLKSLLSTLSEVSFNLLGVTMDVELSFGKMVIEPFFAYLVLTLLIIVFTFAAVRFGNVKASYVDVLVRFSAFLVPFVFLLLIGLIFAILNVKIAWFFLLLSFLGSIFGIPPLVLFTFKQTGQEGMDVVYGILLVDLLTIISLFIMGDVLMESAKTTLENLFSML